MLLTLSQETSIGVLLLFLSLIGFHSAAQAILLTGYPLELLAILLSHPAKCKALLLQKY